MSKSITSAINDWKGWEVLPTSRRLTQWTFAALRLTLLLGSLFLITWVVDYNPVSWDLTEERLFSISPQTRQVLESLDQPILLTAFVQGGDDPGIERVLMAYADASRRVDYRLVDPEARPDLAAEFNVREYGTLIVEGAERVQRADKIEEPEITNAILAVIKGEPLPVCFTVGHGERSTEDKTRTGLSSAATALWQTNYEVRLVNVAAEGEVPADCRVVVIAGPSSDLLPPERAAIERYVESGGRLAVLLESRTEVPEINRLLARWGVRAADDYVIDTRRNGQQFGLGLQVPLVDEYAPHPITERFRLMSMFNMPRSLVIADEPPEGVDIRALAATTASSWGETNFDRNVPATWDAGADRAGPLPLLVAVARAVEETPRAYRERMRRGEPAPVGEPIMVVAGDVDFATNALFGWQGDGDLFLNSINWLAGQRELISIRPKKIANKRVLLTEGRKALSFVLLVVLLPMIPAVAGVAVMIKKVK